MHLGKELFIVAEIGVNASRDINLAKNMIDAAKWAGAGAVKFQTYSIDRLVSKTASPKQYEMLKKYECPNSFFISLKQYCDKVNIVFLSTPHTEDAIDFLDPLVPMFKVGSGDFNNYPFLEKIISKKKQLIISTGMTNLEEIRNTVKFLDKHKANYILMHCTSLYPCPIDKLNLAVIPYMQKLFKCPIGFSDHSETIDWSIMAAKAFNVKIIERHFTLDKNIEGPDNFFSLDPNQLRLMIDKIKDTSYSIGLQGIPPVAMGLADKKLSYEEKDMAKKAQKSLVANTSIKKGTKLARSMISIMRPGTGIKPNMYHHIHEYKANGDIKKGDVIFPRNISLI